MAEGRRVIADPASIDTVIYHHPCNDGFGAAYVIWRHFYRELRVNPSRMPRFLGFGYNNTVPSLVGKTVLMVDISWKRTEMLRMAEEADALLVLDHHETAQQELEGLDFAVFDMERSGVMLAWDYVHAYSTETIPAFLHYIGLRDLWKHKTHLEAEAFTTAFPGIHEFAAFEEYEYAQKVAECIQQGRRMLADKEALLEQMATKATHHVWHLLDGDSEVVHVVLLNVGHPWVSDMGDYLTRDDDQSHKVAMLWSKEAGRDVQVSLRSNAENGPNVGQLAKRMNGGGHAHAAGFRMDTFPETLLDDRCHAYDCNSKLGPCATLCCGTKTSGKMCDLPICTECANMGRHLCSFHTHGPVVGWCGTETL